MKFKVLLATASLIAVALPASAQTAKPVYGDWGYNSSAMDKSVKPGDDFWAYVNGTWNKNTQIAADLPEAGPFMTLVQKSETDVRDVVEQLAKNPNRDRLSQQIGDYYASFVDQSAIDAAGTAPLKPYLSQIDAVRTRGQLMSLFVKPGFASPVDVSISPDAKHSDRYSATAGQARLGLPSREYYLDQSAKMKAHRAAYRDYIINIEKLAGLPGGAAAADRIIALETALSKVQWAAADRRDIDKTYNPMTVAQLSKLAPQFQWASTLAKAGLGSSKSIIVSEPSAVSGAGKILASTPLSTWKEWLAFRFVSDHASYLPKPIDDAKFGFLLDGAQRRSAATRPVEAGHRSGQRRARRRRRRNVREVAFPGPGRSEMKELIGNLEDAYRERITNNKWMDEATRKAALEKLAAFDPRIGHPVKYIDYSSMEVVKGDPLGNAMRAADFDWALSAEAFPQAGRSLAVGNVPADGERLLRTRSPTRSPFRPRSFSRPSSTRTPTRPPITAPSAQ